VGTLRAGHHGGVRHRSELSLVLAAVVAIVAVAMASPALAAKTVTITGGGWGNGMGMSQYGAYGRALKGTGAGGILRHYYSGARVKGRRMPKVIRVGLLDGRDSVATGSSGAVSFGVAGSDRRLAQGVSADSFRIEASATGGVRLYKNDILVKRKGSTVFGAPGRPLMLRYRGPTLVHIFPKATDYAHGVMSFGTYAGCGRYCLRLVLSLSMQKYLYGLGEVPSSWPAAALEAQATAGRTYAYEKAGRLGGHRFPCDCTVYDSTFDQAYIGDSKRTTSGVYWDDWKRAVKGTKGKVIVHTGAPIQALYSSSSGGHTEHNENVWGGEPIAYLRGVNDRADAVAANPNHRWTETMSYDELSRRLDAAFGIGALRDIDLVPPFGVSGRVTVVKGSGKGGVRIVGAKRTARVSGYSIKNALNLRDSLFRISIVGRKRASTGDRRGRMGAGPSGVVPDGLPRAAVRDQRATLTHSH